MPRVVFTQNIQRHVACPPRTVHGNTLRAALEDIFTANPAARGYILDDQGALRKHIAVFIGGELVRDREHLSDAVAGQDEIYVMQALSGG